MDLRQIFTDNYFEVLDIVFNTDSTDGNVYIVYSKDKYVIKVYDDLKHALNMIKLHTTLYEKGFNVPSIILNKKGDAYTLYGSKYIVTYSFLEGEAISSLESMPYEKIAKEIRHLHDETKNMDFLPNTPFDNSLKRKSLLHFDLTKANIFYSENFDNKIGFIDFDDAKYGPSVIDVAIAIPLLFISKKKGLNEDGMIKFIKAYYDGDFSELPYIAKYAIEWIDYTLCHANLNSSVKLSFEYKKIVMNTKFDEIIKGIDNIKPTL